MHIVNGFVYLHRDLLLLCEHVLTVQTQYGLTAVFLFGPKYIIQWMPCICVNTATNEPWTEILPEKVACGTSCCV